MRAQDSRDESPRKDSVSLSKRALLKAGWMAPVIVAVSLPASGYAQNTSRRPGTRPRPR
jgi:hypothetical protein